MTTNQIIVALNGILEELDFPAVQPFEYKNDFKSYMLMDSLDFVEFIMEIEKHFNILITDEAAGRIETFEELIALIENLKS